VVGNVADGMTLGAVAALAAITFLAGLANGLTGFAFALIATGTYLQFLPHEHAVPVVITLSLVAQAAHFLREPRLFAPGGLGRALPFLIGGLPGVPLGVWLSHGLDRELFRTLVGAFLIAYSAYLLLARPPRFDAGRVADFGIGLLSGVLGGLAGLSGALVSAWCALKPWDKAAQRAAYQPFIVLGQGFALIGHIAVAGYPSEVALQSAIGVPPLLVGMVAGYALYRRLDDLLFRRVVLMLLLLAGLLLVL
jgi:uncharacterized membrane protein YfcA